MIERWEERRGATQKGDDMNMDLINIEMTLFNTLPHIRILQDLMFDPDNNVCPIWLNDCVTPASIETLS